MAVRFRATDLSRRRLTTLGVVPVLYALFLRVKSPMPAVVG